MSTHTFTETIIEQAHHMDRADAPRTNPDDLGAYAHWYAQQGINVFPLKPGDKTPATPNGFKNATTDPTQITTWWTQNPHYNIGLPCGLNNGFDVWDIDGPAGYHSWLTDPGLDIGTHTNDTTGVVTHTNFLGMVLTPNGCHIYIQTKTPDRGCDQKVWPGIDLRGTGGYVVAPPSIGPNNQPYIWLNPLNTTGIG